MFISIDDVVIEERIREEDKGTDYPDFKESFKKLGQLQPIKVEFIEETGKYRLLTGKRRYTAISELNAEGEVIPGNEKGKIEVTIRDDVPQRTKLIIEFTENEKRKDFNFLEKAKFIRRFHETMAKEYGESWTAELTAHTLHLSPASISHYLRVEAAVKTNDNIAKAKTLNAAVKRMKLDESTKKRLEAVTTVNDGVIQRAHNILAFGDAREWFNSIDDGTVDLVNLDPPWGDNTSYKSANNNEAFDDSTEYAESLMHSLLAHAYRVLKDDRFCIFYFRSWAGQDMAKLAESYGFNLQFTRTPCIWYKPEKTTDQNRTPEKQLIEAYETFYLLRKGNPTFYEKYTHNVFAFPRVTIGSLIHPTEKPLEFCNALIRLCTVPGETIVDPTAGSAAMLDAALRSNRKAKGCELSEKYYERGTVRIAEYLKTFTV